MSDTSGWLDRQRVKRFNDTLDAAVEEYRVHTTTAAATRTARFEAYLDRIATALERIADK